MRLERTREREALITGGGAPGEALSPRARPGCRRQSGRAEKGLPGVRQAPPGDRGAGRGEETPAWRLQRTAPPAQAHRGHSAWVGRRGLGRLGHFPGVSFPAAGTGPTTRTIRKKPRMQAE